MRSISIGILLLASALSSSAQLTTQQKLADFQTMADQYLRRYVALQWKNVLFGVNGFDTQTYLQRVAATTNDLDFYEVCNDYVAQFKDGGHVFFQVPSDFLADTGIRVDTYERGKPLIYSINRTLLPASAYPFQIGDEIVSIDGTPAADVMKSFSKYGIQSNPRTGEAYAALYLTVRPQSVLPHAVDTPDSSKIVIRRQNGNLETYTIAWVKSGVPLTKIGPAPPPGTAPGRLRNSGRSDQEVDGIPVIDPLLSEIPLNRAVTGVGAVTPVFAAGLPANFRLRLAGTFFSGTYQSGNFTIGFIRIPNFSPAVGITAALAQFESEIAFFQANTDGLVIDDMRNNGGTIYYGAEIARRLIPSPFHLVGFELRATREWVNTYSNYVLFDQAIGAPSYVINYQIALLNDVIGAYAADAHTGPVPIDVVAFSPAPPVPSLDTTPATAGYRKPILILTDEFSFSTAEYFPAIMQDNNAATLYGFRTGGLGGTNFSYNAGAFSEATVGMLRGLMYRKNLVTAPGYPPSYYIENVGVQPDVVDDYKTLDNLLTGGRTFVNNFTASIVNLIQGKKP